MKDDRLGPAGSMRHLPKPYRNLILLPLAYGVCVAVRGAGWTLAESGQALSFYLVNTAISLAPGVVYGAAAILFLLGWRRPVAWLVLLAGGVALVLIPLASVFQLGLEDASYLDYAGFLLEPMLLPLYLTVLAAIEVRRRDAKPSAHLTDEWGHIGRSHVQL